MLPAAFYEAQQRGRKQAQVMKKTRPEAISVDSWLGGYRFLYPDRRSPTTKYDHWKMLRPFQQRYATERMWEITPIQAQAWALKHPAQVKLLRMAWKRAVQMQVAPIDVWAYVVMPERTKERRRPPTEDELAAILKRADGKPGIFGQMIRVAAYSGARASGLCGLRIRDLDLEGRRMTITEKGSKTRTVVLPPQACDALEEVAELTRGFNGKQGGWGFIFLIGPVIGHRPFEVARDIGPQWRAVRGDFQHGFHSLRHYCATWMAMQGVGAMDIAVQLGHTDAAGRPYERLIHRVYDHPDPEEALARIEAVVAGEAA